MKYCFSQEWTDQAKSIAQDLELGHLELDRVTVIESSGSKARRVIARIHGFGRAMQVGMQESPFYVIELITERFGRLNEDDKTKTMIHELLHIPHSFGGGFRHHKPYVNSKTVDSCFAQLKEKRECREFP